MEQFYIQVSTLDPIFLFVFKVDSVAYFER